MSLVWNDMGPPSQRPHNHYVEVIDLLLTVLTDDALELRELRRKERDFIKNTQPGIPPPPPPPRLTTGGKNTVSGDISSWGDLGLSSPNEFIYLKLLRKQDKKAKKIKRKRWWGLDRIDDGEFDDPSGDEYEDWGYEEDDEDAEFDLFDEVIDLIENLVDLPF